MMVDIIFIELGFAWGYQKYICWIKNACQEPLHTWRTSSIILTFQMIIMMVGIIFSELDFASGFQKYIILRVLSENVCQEPPHTWRMSSKLLRFLMVILMVGVFSTELDSVWGFQKYIILGVLGWNNAGLLKKVNNRQWWWMMMNDDKQTPVCLSHSPNLKLIPSIQSYLFTSTSQLKSLSKFRHHDLRKTFPYLLTVISCNMLYSANFILKSQN